MMTIASNSFNIDRVLSTIQRRWVPASAAFLVMTLGMFSLISKQKVIYQAEGKLRFERNSSTAQITGLMKELGELSPLGDKSNPISTEIEVLKTTPILKETIEKLNLKNKKGEPISSSDFLASITVTEVRGTDVVKVVYKDANSDLALKAVDTLMEVYIQHNIQSHRQQTAAARKFLEEQIPKAELHLRSSASALRQFKEANQMPSFEKDSIGTMEGLTAIDRNIVESRSQLAASSASSANLRSRLGMSSDRALALTAMAQSASVQTALKETQQLESQLAIAQGKYQNDHPAIQTLKAKLTEARGILDRRVAEVPSGLNPRTDGDLQFGTFQQEITKELVATEGKRQSIEQQLATLTAQRDRLNDHALELPALEETYRGLERSLQADQTTYAHLLQKISEVRMAENQNVGNAQIIAAAEVPELLEKAKSGLMAGGLLGLLAAAVTIYLLEALDQSIKTVDRSCETFGFPLLGVIPHMGTGPTQFSPAKFSPTQWFRPTPAIPKIPSLIVKDSPRSATSAAFRMLQSNLIFAGTGQSPRSIAITSAMPQEGKSTIAANLAVSVSQLGKKVLLIDADLHAPFQHQIWDVPSAIGLTTVLVGQTELQQAVVTVLPDLDLLPAGILPPNPSALLGAQSMANLLDRAMRQYDFVILDTPPISIAADAAVLGKWSDGVVLVVRAGQLKTQQATFAKTCLDQSGQKVLGQVVNDVIAKQEPHSTYYFIDLPKQGVEGRG